MKNILASYKDIISESNIDMYLEELVQEDDLWYRVVNDEIEFKDYRHERLKSIQNYNDFEKILKESYEQKRPSREVANAAIGDSDGNEPRWKNFAIRYNSQFVKFNNELITYGN